MEKPFAVLIHCMIVTPDTPGAFQMEKELVTVDTLAEARSVFCHITGDQARRRTEQMLRDCFGNQPARVVHVCKVIRQDGAVVEAYPFRDEELEVRDVH